MERAKSLQEAFRQNLKAWREARKMTQGELARRCGVEQRSISYYESGDRTPRAYIALLIAEALGCRVEDLFKEV